MTSDAGLDASVADSGDELAPVLLVEDDDGDALLVEELLLDVDAPVAFRRARSLGQARAMVAEAACVLLDLGLPDSRGLQGLRQLLEVDLGPVHIEYCDRCQGIFLDKGELDQAVQAVQGSTVREVITTRGITTSRPT